MKKLKLFFAACALLLGVSNVSAQLTDGTVYWIQDASTGQFISQGDNWSTKAVAQDVGGLGFEVVKISDDVYKLNNIMWNTVKNATVGLGTDVFVDQTPAEWTITASGNGYLIKNGENYLVNNGEENDYKEKPIGKTTDEGAATVWKFLTKNEYDAAIQAYKDSKAATYATNLGYSASSVAELETLLSTNFISKDYTSSITNASLSSNDQGWTHGKLYRGNDSGGWAVGNGCAEFWSGCGYANPTIGSLPNGIYKITFVGTYRPDNNTAAEKLSSEKASSPAFVYANDAKIEFLHWIDVPAKANGRSGITTANGYGHSFYTYVSDGTLALGVVADGWTGNYNWNPFGQFTLTYYTDKVSDEDIAALVATIPTEVPTAVTDNLNSLKSTLESKKTISAYNALSDAIQDAKAIETAYVHYNTVKAAVLAVKGDIDVTTADATANAATTVKGINDAVAIVRNALTSSIADIENETIDLTAALIDNASPGTAGNTDYWTNSAAPGLEYQLYEFYNIAGATSKQTIATQLPVGYYTLTVIGYTREGYDGFINAGEDNHQTLVGVAKDIVNNRNQGNSWIAQGNGVNAMTFNLTAPTSNLEIGITAGQEGDRWTCWRSFKLEFLGTAPLAKFQKELADAVEVANDHATNDLKSKIPTAAYNAFTTAVSTAATQNTTTDECLQAIQDIEDATNTADACVSPYADFNALKEKANTLQAVGNDNASANTTLATAITAQSYAVEDATTTSAIEAVTSDLKEAMITYVGAANPVGDGAKFDCTFMLTNPDLTPFYTGGHGVHPAGWATEQADGNYQVIPSEGAANPDGIHKYCYEYWSENPKDNSKFNLYTPVTLPEGTYTMSCYAFADQPINGDNCAVYFYANETQGGLVSDAKLTQKSISFVNDTEQEVKIGLKPLTGNTYRWMGIGYVELYKVPAKTYTVSEDAAYDNTQSGAGDVTLNRTIIVGYNTIVLPFSMTQKEVEDQFGEGSVVYELNSFENEVIGFKTADGISPNTPYILKATEAGTSYDIKGRTIVAGDANPTSTVGAVSLIGSYDDEFIVPQTGDNYVVSKGNLYLVNSEVKIKGTRAYFNVVGNQAREISFDGVLTGIATVEKGELKKVFTGDIFDLTGRKVKNPSNGIFVVEGKKVVF